MSEGHATCLVDTRDLDEARALVGASYCDHRIDVRRPARSFHAVQTEVALGALALHRLSYGADLVVSASPLRRVVLVTSPLRGRLTVTVGRTSREVLPGDVVALGPDHEFSLVWSEDCVLSTVRLGRGLVEAAAHDAGLPTGETLDFDLAHAPGPAAAERWLRLVTLLEADAQADDGFAASPLLTRRLEDVVAGTVVRSHRMRGPLGAMAHGATGADGATPRHVRRAVEFLHEHTADPVSLTGLAAAVGSSPRGLQAGFRRHFGTSPMRLLADLRMQRARADLERADPTSSVTVAEVAHAWGFGHLGRFAHDYRVAFGELPSTTLRR